MPKQIQKRRKIARQAVVLRYDDKLAKLLGAKTKPEPWLHCLVCIEPSYAPVHNCPAEVVGAYVRYVTYVWDTREVVEQTSSDLNLKTSAFWQFYDKLTTCKVANDNHDKLRGFHGLSDVKVPNWC